MLRTFGGYVLGATAFVACPCHLALTLPLLTVLLGGTSVGALLVDNFPLVVVGASAYFVLALAGTWWLLRRRSGADTISGREGARPAAGDGCCAPPHAIADRAAERVEALHG